MSENSLEEKIMALADDGAHLPPDAYRFVYQVVLEAVQRLGKPRHISAVEVLEAFRIAVERDFGNWGAAVLDEWGMNTPTAVGRAVFDLVKAGALSADSRDSIDDFNLSGIALCSEESARSGAAEADKWKGEWID